MAKQREIHMIESLILPRAVKEIIWSETKNFFSKIEKEINDKVNISIKELNKDLYSTFRNATDQELDERQENLRKKKGELFKEASHLLEEQVSMACTILQRAWNTSYTQKKTVCSLESCSIAKQCHIEGAISVTMLECMIDRLRYLEAQPGDQHLNKPAAKPADILPVKNKTGLKTLEKTLNKDKNFFIICAEYLSQMSTSKLSDAVAHVGELVFEMEIATNINMRGSNANTLVKKITLGDFPCILKLIQVATGLIVGLRIATVKSVNQSLEHWFQQVSDHNRGKERLQRGQLCNGTSEDENKDPEDLDE